MFTRSRVLLMGAGLAGLAVIGSVIGIATAESRSSWFGTTPAANVTSITPGPPAAQPTPPHALATDDATLIAMAPPTGTEKVAGLIDLDRAVNLAVAAAGDGRVVEAELEREDGVPVWTVELISGVIEIEVEIDAVTGAVRQIEREIEREIERKDDWDVD
jgi:hypothetical protein